MKWPFQLCFHSIALFFLFISSVVAEYPQIKIASKDDFFYAQIQSDISLFHRNIAQGLPSPALTIYRYKTNPNETLIQLASRFSLTYETLATLNKISNSSELPVEQEILVPNQPGIFIPVIKTTDFETLLQRSRMEMDTNRQTVKLFTGPEAEEFHFYPGDSFSGLERAFFLSVIFRFPLSTGRISSSFGLRADPFTGKNSFHQGIDIAAPGGTEVMAVREGIVKKTSFDPIYGNFIILNHSSGYNTLYGHLSASNVVEGQRIGPGEVIGKVGNTGQSTGNHLHFEIQLDGQTIDPLLYMR